MMSIHRSAGGVGETITPLVVAAALIAITWRQVLVAGFLLITLVAIALFITLSRLGLRATEQQQPRNAGEQVRSIAQLFRNRALPTLLLVAGLRGMADRGFVFFLPLFIAEDMKLKDPDVSVPEVAAVVAFHFFLMSIMSIMIPPLIGLIADRTGRKPVMVVTLVGSSVIAVALAIVGEVGWAFTALIGLFGAVRFAVTNLTQAASLDIAEGKRLEGSMIGLLWGNNATWGALSPIILGGLITVFASAANEFQMMFAYVAVLTIAATVAGFFLPNTGKPEHASERSLTGDLLIAFGWAVVAFSAIAFLFAPVDRDFGTGAITFGVTGQSVVMWLVAPFVAALGYGAVMFGRGLSRSHVAAGS
jgi:MFS family permease